MSDRSSRLNSFPDAAFSPDGERLITTGIDGTYLWMRPFTDEPHLLSEMPGFASSFHPSGDLVALSVDQGAVGSAGLVEIRDLGSGEVVAEIRGHQDSVWRLGFSPDGRWLVTGSLDATAIIWDVETFQPQHHLVGHQGAVLEVAFDPTRPPKWQPEATTRQPRSGASRPDSCC